jgi:hypothetical protein
MILALLMALALGAVPVNAETFKCVDASGNAVSQATPCRSAADETVKFQAPGATATPAGSAAASAPDVPHPLKGRVPSEADFRGPRETWDRLTQAVRRGDKDAALKELTPAAQQRLAPMFESVGAKSGALNADELGSVRAVSLAGNGMATLKLTRKKSDGSYAHDVMLIRDADGKWRIDGM